jgi:phosphatidylethanolamine-binding protein (PEBP) family uncharacterized protein
MLGAASAIHGATCSVRADIDASRYLGPCPPNLRIDAYEFEMEVHPTFISTA